VEHLPSSELEHLPSSELGVHLVLNWSVYQFWTGVYLVLRSHFHSLINWNWGLRRRFHRNYLLCNFVYSICFQFIKVTVLQ
jgi:hypothetical protein